MKIPLPHTASEEYLFGMFNCGLAKAFGYSLLTLASMWRCPAANSASFATSVLQSDMTWRSNAINTSLGSESEDPAQLEYLSKKECFPFNALSRGSIPPAASPKKSTPFESQITSLSQDYAGRSLGRSPPFDMFF